MGECVTRSVTEAVIIDDWADTEQTKNSVSGGSARDRRQKARSTFSALLVAVCSERRTRLVAGKRRTRELTREDCRPEKKRRTITDLLISFGFSSILLKRD